MRGRVIDETFGVRSLDEVVPTGLLRTCPPGPTGHSRMWCLDPRLDVSVLDPEDRSLGGEWS